MSEEQLSEIVGGLDWNLGFAEGEKESKHLHTFIVRPSRAIGSNSLVSDVSFRQHFFNPWAPMTCAIDGSRLFQQPI